VQSEVKPFGIQILIIEPASVRTEGSVGKLEIDESNPIADYNEIRETTKARMKGFKDTLRGDAPTAARVMIEVASMREGDDGKKWPLYLPLGDAAVQAIKNKTSMILGVAEEWKEVVKEL
jgi:hypothetical protein